LQLPDARILGRHADAVILVVRAQHTTRDSARLACERLEADGIPLLGTILNNWNPAKATSSYGYGADNYSYRYTDRDRPAA
jgi:Mrp family chromosome partitioning ATPase